MTLARLALLLPSLLLAVGEAKDPAPSAVQSQLARAPANARLEVKLPDGGRIKGRLGSVSMDGSSFVLRVLRNGVEANETVPISGVKSVRRIGSTAAKVALGGGLGVGGALAVLLWISCNI